MVNKNIKGHNPNQNRGTSKGRNISKNNKIAKNKEGGKNLYTWYIDNKIAEKKKQNEDIENNKAKYFEDVTINKNVEEYINVICRIKNNINNINNINNNNNNNNVDVIKKISYNKLVIDTFHVGNKSSLNFEYTYDRVYDIENNNQMIFNDYIKNNIKNIFQGINCSILAYGQTNSGKTYTMLGNFDFLNNLFHLCKDKRNYHKNDNQKNKTHDQIKNKNDDDVVNDNVVNDNVVNDNVVNNDDNIKSNIHMNKCDENNDIHLTYDELINCITNEPNNVGIIPHCINYIFNYINYHKQNVNVDNKINDKIKEFTVTLSILEIYNEVIYDLISGESNLSVHMIDSNKNEFIIKNLKEVEIENIISALYYLEQGVNNRKIAFTHMNKASSRSHLIFIIKINRYIYSTNTIRCGKLCLVDLAGSERLKQTKATGSIKIETTMINKSLTVLSKVINSLAIMQIKEKIDKNMKEKEKGKHIDDNNVNQNNINDTNKKQNNLNDHPVEGYDNQIDVHKNHPEDTLNTQNNININNNNNHINNSSHNTHTGSSNVHIPYRDSKLTRVLSDSLGNNCKSILICTLSSQLQYLNETASTIKFAQRAKMVKAKPIVREEKVETEKELDAKEKNKNKKIKINKKKNKNNNNNDDKSDDTSDDNNNDDNNDNYDDDKNNPCDNKLNIFLNFNKNHITKDIIFFCFSLCIFSYICGFKSTGKVKYLDFFIESYKNKIDIIKEQLNKSEDSNRNDINEYLIKTFDDLKLLTEEEKQRNIKLNMEKLKKYKHDNKNIINPIQNKQENDEHALTLRNLVKVDPTLISKYDIQKGYEHNNNKKVDYDDERGHHIKNIDDNNNDDIHINNNDNTHIYDNDDDDILIGDILVKMKNDICNIIKFNLTSLKSNKKENDEIFEEILHIVNSVKENNNIFLINELKHNLNDNITDKGNNKIDDILNDDKTKKKKNIQSDNINMLDDITTNNNNNNRVSFKAIKNMNIVKKYLKKDDINKNKNTKSILNINNNKDENKYYQDNNYDSYYDDKNNYNYNSCDDKNVDNKKKKNKKIIIHNNNIREKNDILYYQIFAQKILSVTNIENIFNYINHNYTKFISDFTTDKSTVFSNFDLKENLDRQIIEKNNSIYNFIHSATMFQNSQTLKNLNSNYFINKIQTEIYNNNYPHIIHMKYMPSLNIEQNIITQKQNDFLVTTPVKKNLSQINKEYKDKTQTYKSIKDIIPDHITDQNDITYTINKSVTFFNPQEDHKKNLQEFSSNKNNIHTDENKKKEMDQKNMTFLNQLSDENKNLQNETSHYSALNNINNSNNNNLMNSKHTTNHSNKIKSYELQEKKEKISKKKESSVHNINVSDLSQNSLEFTKLLDDKDFKKLYEYLIDKENTNDVNTCIQKEEHVNNALNQLECKINGEIKRVSDHIVVEYSANNINENTNTKYNSVKKNDIYNNIDNNNNMMMVVKKKKEKNNNNLDISYLEKKRNTNLFIKKIFHIIKNIFQKKDFKEPIEINVSDIIDNELLYNKKLLEKNLDSYNIRNFFINNKKIYLLNESEYSHLRELINYKNKMLSYLNGEYKKYKHASQYKT